MSNIIVMANSRKVIFLILVFIAIVAAEYNSTQSDNVVGSERTELSRKRKTKFPFHGILGYGFGFHALAILYWIKVKLIIIAFAIGAAVAWGVRYFWAHKPTCPEVKHDGPIIPYYHDHSFTEYSSHPGEVSIDPYSAYSSYAHSAPGPEIISSSPPSKRKGRQLEENQISEIFFYILGLGSDGCRKRFLCEVEYKSKEHPLTSLAFRVFGRTIFANYAQRVDDENRAKSFKECATVYKECTVIEENIPFSTGTAAPSSSSSSSPSSEAVEDTSTDTPAQIKDMIAERILSKSKRKNNKRGGT